MFLSLAVDAELYFAEMDVAAIAAGVGEFLFLRLQSMLKLLLLKLTWSL